VLRFYPAICGFLHCVYDLAGDRNRDLFISARQRAGQIDKLWGLKIIASLFADDTFLRSVVNTVFFTLVNTSSNCRLSLFLAILLSSPVA